MKKIWRIWALALGRKEGRNDRDADHIAFLRTIILVQAITTNIFIISGVVRHWNDVPLNNGTISSKLWPSHAERKGINIM